MRSGVCVSPTLIPQPLTLQPLAPHPPFSLLQAPLWREGGHLLRIHRNIHAVPRRPCTDWYLTLLAFLLAIRCAHIVSLIVLSFSVGIVVSIIGHINDRVYGILMTVWGLGIASLWGPMWVKMWKRKVTLSLFTSPHHPSTHATTLHDSLEHSSSTEQRVEPHLGHLRLQRRRLRERTF